ncbi:hypothetical protein ONZ45_g16816 [Pleurotus djamor]|nr:hypothetical protein ONZ45_g16816 [Pleurotus djamor]
MSLLQGIPNMTLERLEADDWSELVPYAKSVETLTLKDCRLRFLNILRPPTDTDGSQELLFPMLKTLILLNYRLYMDGEHLRLSALLRARKIDTVKCIGGSASYIAKNHFSRRNIDIQWDDTKFNHSLEFETDGEDWSDEEEESESEYGSEDDGSDGEVDVDDDQIDDGPIFSH